jgi:hypothetical protein
LQIAQPCCNGSARHHTLPGLDSINRRKALAFLLGIPPALLGLDTTKHEPVLDLESPTLVMLRALTPDILLGYQQRQKDLFTEYYTT